MKKEKINHNSSTLTEVFNLSKKQEKKVIEMCDKLFSIYIEIPDLKPLDSEVIEKIIPLFQNENPLLISIVVGKVLNVICRMETETLLDISSNITKIISESFFQFKKKGE